MPLPRRLRSFSLRTLMVLVGLSCVVAAWLADARRVTVERRRLRALLEAAGNRFEVATANDRPRGRDGTFDIPLGRRLVGDQAIRYVVRATGDPGPNWPQLERLFPEAEVAVRMNPVLYMDPASAPWAHLIPPRPQKP